MAIGITRHCIPFGGAGGIMLPDTPANLRITSQDATSATLQWDAHSQQTRVYISSDGASWSLLDTVAAGTSTYQATGLTDDLNFFQVRAYDGTHQSAASNTVETYLKWFLKSTGNGSGVSTLRLTVSETQTLTAAGGVTFYTDSGGTQGASSTWQVTSGGTRTIYLKCPTDGVIVIPARDKVTEFGNSGSDGWASGNNAADLHHNVSRLTNLERLRHTDTCHITGAPPIGIIQWVLLGNGVYWSYDGIAPPDVNIWYFSGNNINWTGQVGNGTGNIGTLYLYNFRTAKFAKEELIAFLEDMTNSNRGFPATVTIGETSGLNVANDPEIQAAVEALKATKNITTVTFVN